MLVDLLSMDNYVQYNIKIAEILGLHPAIYISELLNINEKAVRKDKVTDDQFVVDRDYIERRTTLPKQEQVEIDTMLLNLGILKKAEDNENGLTLDLTVLTSLVAADPVSIKNLEKVITAAKQVPKKKRTKAEVIIDSLKERVTTTNQELKEAYSDWIDAVYSKQGWMSVKSVTSGQRLIDEYSNHNLDLALLILDIAALNAYRDIQWAINKYEAEYRVKYNFVTAAPVVEQTVSVGEEVF